jgi:predicted PurR-regulated permease PerM
MLIALLLLAVVFASAMRPGIEWLHARRIPRSVGVLLHYAAVLIVIGLLLWLIVPRALHQTENALGTLPTSSSDVAQAARNSHGVKHEVLVAIQHRLERLPSGAGLIHPAVTYGQEALKVLVAIFFVFAIAARPFAAVLATIIDVSVFDSDSGRGGRPALIFPAKDVAETG